ncbi:hypothetical protein V2J09_009126 [Rumex salicifolius]
MNPLMWRPITGIGSFDLPTYDIELTPLFGNLLDRKKHKIGFGVTNALNAFWRDKTCSETVGQVSSYQAPPLSISETRVFRGLNWTFVTKANRSISSIGVKSSHGNITTSLTQDFGFHNRQIMGDNGSVHTVNQTVKRYIIYNCGGSRNQRRGRGRGRFSGNRFYQQPWSPPTWQNPPPWALHQYPSWQQNPRTGILGSRPSYGSSGAPSAYGPPSEFYNLILTQFKVKIQHIQCDNGKEFDNSSFHSFFRDNGLQFRFSCPHTSQQNGKAERILRTINNSVRTLLFQAHLPPKFWVEPLNTAVHLINRLPSKPIHNKIPYEVLYGRPPVYHPLWVFGCACYPNLSSTAPHKLSPRSTKCVFLGYPSNHSGYRCMDLATNKIIISRHVVFDESYFPFQHDPSPPSPAQYDFLDYITLHQSYFPSQHFPPTNNHSSSPTSIHNPTTPPSSPPSTSASTAQLSAAPQHSSSDQSPPTTSPEHSPQPAPQASPPPQHHMMTRSRMGIHKPKQIFNLSTSQLKTSVSTMAASSRVHRLRSHKTFPLYCYHAKEAQSNGSYIDVERYTLGFREVKISGYGIDSLICWLNSVQAAQGYMLFEEGNVVGVLASTRQTLPRKKKYSLYLKVNLRSRIFEDLVNTLDNHRDNDPVNSAARDIVNNGGSFGILVSGNLQNPGMELFGGENSDEAALIRSRHKTVEPPSSLDVSSSRLGCSHTWANPIDIFRPQQSTPQAVTLPLVGSQTPKRPQVKFHGPKQVGDSSKSRVPKHRDDDDTDGVKLWSGYWTFRCEYISGIRKPSKLDRWKEKWFLLRTTQGIGLRSGPSNGQALHALDNSFRSRKNELKEKLDQPNLDISFDELAHSKMPKQTGLSLTPPPPEVANLIYFSEASNNEDTLLDKPPATVPVLAKKAGEDETLPEIIALDEGSDDALTAPD